MNELSKKLCIWIVLFSSICVLTGCDSRKELDLKARDRILEKAYADIKSSEKSEVINGIRIIAKYPTHRGLRELIHLWETEVPKDTDDELLSAMVTFEEFRLSESLVEEIFRRNYSNNMTQPKKEKLSRLLEKTRTENRNIFIQKLSS